MAPSIFAKKEYLDKYLQIKPGSVSPFALVNDTKNEVKNFKIELIKRAIRKTYE
mgnify:CR=1 FL=1